MILEYKLLLYEKPIIVLNCSALAIKIEQYVQF